MINTIELEAYINSPDAKKFKGTAAIFIPIDNEWGVKLFPCESRRNLSYTSNVKMYKKGLAPLYGPKVSLVYEEKRYYGYLMELVSCADQAALAHFGKEHNGMCANTHDSELDYWEYCACSSYKNFIKEDEMWGDAWFDLLARTESAGLSYRDSHAGNWGITKEGESVWIDFDKSLVGLSKSPSLA